MSMMWQKLMSAPAGAGGIEFVGGAVASKAGATSGNSTISLSSGLTGGIASGVSANDFVLAVFATGSTADRTLAITDGTTDYTLVGSELYGNSTRDVNFRVAYKFMGGTPDASTTFGPSGSAADASAMAVYVFRGVDQSTPLDVAVQGTADGTNSDPDPLGITPSTSGAFIVVIGARSHINGTQTFTSSDLIDFLTIGRDGSVDITLGIGHKDNWTSGEFNPAAFSLSSSPSGASRAAMTIALRPA